jgi:hypothetical protein
MLDISIAELGKAIKTKKAASDFVRKHIKVVEKIDGTKLTLIRNDAPFNPTDYTKNWIVAYKGNVIYPTEFSGLEKRGKDIQGAALGTSQYKFVHDHLKKVHSGTSDIPQDTEFFIEFVQNKPTVTRDYAKKHGMFLVGFGPATYAESKGQIYSSSTFVDDPVALEEYRRTLQLGAFPLLYEGNLSSRSEIFENSIYLDPKLESIFAKNLADADFSDPQSILASVIVSFQELESSLGGQSEGVVITVGGDDISEKQLYKVLAADQHSKETREKKKSRYKGTPEEETAYWNDINSTVDNILDEILSEYKGTPPEQMMDALSSHVYNMSEKDINAYHPAKTLINKQEDLMLTAKTRLFVLGHKLEKIAVIPMAAKPFHRGHQALLDAAEADGNELILVYVSTGGREEISSSDMVPLWKNYYLPAIRDRYGDKVAIRFTKGASPMYELRSSITNLVRQTDNTVVTLYGDPEDAEQRVQSIISNEKNAFDLAGKVIAGSIPREASGGISGTRMREFLSTGRKNEFLKNLPDFLSDEAKEAVWTTLSKSAPANENLLKTFVKLLLA